MAPSAAHPTDATACPGSVRSHAFMLMLLMVICQASSSSAARVHSRPLDSLDSVDLIEAFEENFRNQWIDLDAIGTSGRSMLEEEDDDMVYIATSTSTLDSASPDLHLPGDAVPASDLVMHEVLGFNSAAAAAAAAVPGSSSRFQAARAAQLPSDDVSNNVVSPAVQEWLSRTL